MLNGFKIIKTLASSQELIIPGHDPLITNFFQNIINLILFGG